MSGFSTARQKMVDGQVRTNDVTDLRIIDAMLELPREQFVPADKRGLAYLDLDLDVGGASAKRYLLRPQVTAKLLQAAGITPEDTVLIVGCATGYVAALAGRLARKVVATESDSNLVAQGQGVLRELGADNVTLTSGEPVDGDPANAPYDVVVLNGAAEMTSERLQEQLKDGGRLVGVFAKTHPARAMIVTRSHGDFGTRVLFDASAPTLPGLTRT